MYYKLITFKGIAPQISPRLLADTMAQTAQDVVLDSGRLVPITDNSTTVTLNASGKTSVYKYTFGGTDYWFEWTADVNVQPAPIPDDANARLYWSGDTFPKMGSSTELIASGSGAYPRSFYRLGIPAPENTITTSIASGSDDGTQTQYSTSYVYTFVSAFGEEGPPSAASTVFTKVDAQTVTVANMSTSAGSGTSRSNTNITKKRIYRSNTGSNTTQFQFVAEVNLNVASYADSTTNANLGELIPSTYWIAPPDENSSLYPNGQMLGLTAMPNGIFAGFSGKRLCFSEPFLPHAWPVAYRITLDEEIVSIAMAGNGLFIGTKGTPYLVLGTDPQSMSAIRIEAAQACLNKRSMVDMGPYVLYAGADGLVAATGTDVQVVTEGQISPAQWRADYYPSSLQGFLWEGRYVGLYTSGSNYGGFIFDNRFGERRITTLTQTATTDASGGFTDPDDNELYLIIDPSSGNGVVKKFQGGTTNQTFTWKSKEFVPERPGRMGFVKVDAEDWPVVIKVYGDGSLIYHATFNKSGATYNLTGSTPSFSQVNIQEPVARLPSGVHRTYSVEIQAAKIVNEVCIAESISEIRSL